MPVLLALLLAIPLLVLLRFLGTMLDRYVINPYWPLSLENAKVRIAITLAVLVCGSVLGCAKLESRRNKTNKKD